MQRGDDSKTAPSHRAHVFTNRGAAVMESRESMSMSLDATMEVRHRVKK